MYFKQFFDEKLAQYAYLIGCQANGTAVIIDPMRDIDNYIEAAAREQLSIVAAADTHIHADYISGLREFAERGVKVYASDEGGEEWKYEWLLNSDYDHELLRDGDSFRIGNITIRAWHTPGHTPEHLSFLITDGAAADEPLGVITGDFVFVGDVGRPDLLESAAGQKGVMEPSARTLYRSVDSFRNLPEYMQIWPGHGAGSACGKALGAVPDSTVGYELRYNNSLKAAGSEEEFVRFILEGQPEPPLYFARMKRDNKLGPKLLNGLAQPRRLSAGEIASLREKEETVILDTRDRNSYASGHLPGSLLSPLNRQFNTVAGSYIDENSRIVLVVEAHRLREAVIDLFRIGLDHVIGYLTPSDLELHKSRGGAVDRLPTIGFEEAERLAENEEYEILDVRNASEFEEFHLSGAENIAHTRLAEKVDSLSDNRHWLVHCQSGGRSAVAAALLRRTGREVSLIEDNIENYREKIKTAAS